MKINMSLGLGKCSGKNAKLLFMLILWYMLAAILMGFFHFPKAIVYIGDLLNIYIFICALHRDGNKGLIVSAKSPFLWMLIFICVGIAGSIINLESPIHILWGLRQNARFFLFFYSCITFLKKEDLNILLGIVRVVFWISLPLTILEAMFWVEVTSYEVIVGDLVGGIYFNIGNGVNAALNTILIIHCTDVVLKYFNKEKKLIELIAVIGAGITMAAMAEMKIFFVQIVIIVFIAMILNKISLKTILLVVLGIIALIGAAILFVKINARGRVYYTLDYISLSGFLQNISRDSGYVGTGDFNRFGAVPGVFNRIFSGDIAQSLFGVGLGNADYSQGFEFLQGPYYKAYGDLHYQWFMTSFVFIETGIFGLLSYFLIYISAMFRRKRLVAGSFFRNFYTIMVVMMLILIIYNPCLRNEQCAFILFMILALPELSDKYENFLRGK